MKVELRILARPGTAAGFALAGMPSSEVATAAEAAERLAALIDDPAVGVILLEDDMHRAIPEDLRRRVARRPLPIVVPFPAAAWQEGPVVDQYIVELLRQVIGYRVRLR